MPTSRRPVLHLISQAHLDPVWLWPLQDGVAETLTTCQSAVDRLGENPGFRFTRSSAAAYDWVRQADPRLFRQIRKAVDEGRWEIVGGWVEQPDCNLPSAESFLRQATHARAFWKAAIGEKAKATIGYNVDSFGHCGGLPQILRLSGMDAYAFMRPEPWDNPDLPLLFWWESPDGSRVLACRIPGVYSQSYSATADDVEKSLREAAGTHFAPGFDDGVMWFGVGNHGGGPTREHIARVLELQSDKSLPEIRFSTLREFLDAVLTSPEAASLPVWRGELGYVFRGCYSANGETKRLHRACEKALFTAEALEVAARGGKGRNPDDLKRAWWDLLNLQFHDILAGTCVASAQEEIIHRFGAVLNTARDRILKNAMTMARRVNTRREKGSVLFCFNPLPWSRSARIHLDTFKRIHGRDEITGLETADGAFIPVQWLHADANFGPWGLPWGKLTASVELPASGYQVLRILTRRVAGPTADPFAKTDSDNPQFGVEETASADATPALLPGPALDTLPLPGLGEMLAGSLGFVVVRDTGGTWGHGKRAYDEILGRPESLGYEILEDGPTFRLCREKFRWEQSEIWLDVIQDACNPTIELRLRINWQQKREQLKLEIPTRLVDPQVHARMPAEIALRPANGAEFPCHDWVALEGKLQDSPPDSPCTLAVLNDATYSYSAEGGVLRFTLVRGVPHAEHPPFDYKDASNVLFLDQGWQERRFALAAYHGSCAARPLDRMAQEFQVPAIALLDSAHAGRQPRSLAGHSVEPENVSVLAIKPGDQGGACVIRIQETLGRPTTARISGPSHQIELPLAPWEITSLRLTSAGNWEQVDVFEHIHKPN